MESSSSAMRLPLRPLLPLLLLPLASCWGGILLASELAYQKLAIAPMLPFTLAGVLAVVMAMSKAYQKTRVVIMMLLALLTLFLGFGSGTLCYGSLCSQLLRESELSGEVSLVVIEDTRSYATTKGSEALVELADGSRVRVRIFWNNTELSLAKGSHVQALANFTPLHSNQRWLFDAGVIGTLSISKVSNQGFSQDLWGAIDSFRLCNVQRIQSLEGDGTALLAGVLLGQREMLQGSMLEQDFITCGLTHLIAVSGSHLAVVAALLGWFLRRLPIGRISEITLLLAVLALYVMLTGLQPSALRSALMAGVAGCSVLIGRRGHAPSALMAAALALLLLNPTNAYSLGFWLSVSAVLGITLFSNLVASWLSTAAPLRSGQSPGQLSQALALTLTAMAATLPLALPTFAVLSLIGPLANLIVAPLVSVVLVLGMMALVITPLVLPLGMILLQAAALVSDVSVFISTALAQAPWASIPLELPQSLAVVLGLGLTGLLYGVWPCPSARILRLSAAGGLAAVCILVQIANYATPPQLIAMDVGQGDALLVREQGRTVLIDTGASETALVHALARNNVREIDAIIITHLDSDHAGALKRLRGLVAVKEVYVACGLSVEQGDHEYLTHARALSASGQVSELSQGQSLRLGNTLSLEVLWPQKAIQEGSNEESICLLLCYDADSNGTPEQQALLTGDAEKEVLTSLLSHYPHLQADIVKVGHHGSRDALTVQQLQELGCSTALISVGVKNRFGHPASETLEALRMAGVTVLRTDEQGDLVCSFR